MTKEKPDHIWKTIYSNEIFSKAITEQSGEGISVADTEGNYLFINPALCEITGYSEAELLTMNIRDITLPGTKMELLPNVLKKQKGKREVELRKKDGSHFFAEILGYPVKIENQFFALGVIHDITKRKEAEERLKHANDELERKVHERTRELTISNQNLLKEIQERRNAEDSLLRHEKELKLQKERLEEMNAALKVLLEHREEERKALEKNIILNAEKTIIPYIDKLASALKNKNARTFLEIIRSNINDLVSPFTATLSSKQMNFTPTEIIIADFIRNGFTNKEISDQINVSIDAVSFHRKNIRKKLGLKNKRINLRTYLLNLSD